MFNAIARAGSSITSCFDIRLYSAAASLRRRDWHTSGHPAPRSLVEREEAYIDLTEDIQDRRTSTTPPLHRREPSKRRTPYEFAAHHAAIKKAFPDGWSPPRKLSREAMDGLRELHMFDPETFTTPLLAERFRISPEAVRRILKSKWEPTNEQRARFAERERRKREQFIQASRLEEMKKQMEVEEERRKWQKTSPRHNFHQSRRTRGVNARDTLTFE